MAWPPLRRGVSTRVAGNNPGDHRRRASDGPAQGPRRACEAWGGGSSVLAAGVDEAQHHGPLLVGGLEVDLDVEAPVVVAGRVVQDLPYPPDAGLALVPDDQRRAAGVRAGAELGVLGEVGLHHLAPPLGVPPGAAVELAEVVPPP